MNNTNLNEAQNTETDVASAGQVERCVIRPIVGKKYKYDDMILTITRIDENNRASYDAGPGCGGIMGSAHFAKLVPYNAKSNPRSVAESG